MDKTEFVSKIVPLDLPVMRSLRYQGDQMSASLAQLGTNGQNAVRRVYETLKLAQKTLADILEKSVLLEEDVPAVGVAEGIASLSLWAEMVEAARQLDSERADRPESVGRVIHDLRGGSLVALIGTVQMLPHSSSFQVDLQRCVCFARDHLKIIRNCLPEIDPDAALRDREARAHDIGLIVEKWAGSEFKVGNVSRKIQFSCTFHGTISERCREFSAIDRVVYNLINNAATHAADGDVALSISGVGTDRPRNVRFVVSNAISPGDAARIGSLCDGQVERLMQGGVSTTGGGMGLRICAEFVCHAYGLRSVDEMLRGGYAGTQIDDGTFVAWFHWPSAA